MRASTRDWGRPAGEQAHVSQPKQIMAERVLERLKASRVQTDTQTYNTLLFAYSQTRPSIPREAERVLERMAEDGVEADTDTYNSIIVAYASVNPPEAKEARPAPSLLPPPRLPRAA